MGCTWCDSRYTWSHNKRGTVLINDVIKQVKDLHSKSPIQPWICITGGEPLEQPEAFNVLADELDSLGYRIEVETSGLVPIPFACNSVIDSWVVDLKCPTAEANQKPVLEDLQKLRSTDQIKCVVMCLNDLEYVRETLDSLDSVKARVLLSPVASNSNLFDEGLMRTCAEYCKTHGYRLSLQTHKFIWGVKRGV